MTLTSSGISPHPFDYYWRPGRPLRPPPPRAVASDVWNHSRGSLFSPWIDLGDDPLENPRVRLFADHLWQGDELMDHVVEALAGAGAGPGPGRSQLEQALEHGIGSLDDPAPQLVALFASIDRRPDWLDLQQWEEGRRIWINASMAGHLAMTIYDGFGTFVGEEVSSATGATGMFTRNLPRRLLETAEWFRDATVPDLTDRFSPAFKRTVRVRLMHAQARRRLRRAWGQQHFAHHGNPISNATTMGAAVTFGLLPLLFDHAHGRKVSRDQLDAAMMYWSYLAYLFGVAEEIIPRSATEGMEIADWMIATAGGPTPWTTQIVGTWLAPLTRPDGSLTRRGAILLPPLLGTLSYFGGEPIVRALVRSTPASELPLQPWATLAGLLVRINVGLRSLSDRLPLARQRRDFRARHGDPDQFRAVRQLRRLTGRFGVRTSTYRYHDEQPSAPPSCPYH